ncbi:hypothetical protein D3C81_1905400 [compost metagenome]
MPDACFNQGGELFQLAGEGLGHEGGAGGQGNLQWRQGRLNGASRCAFGFEAHGAAR